MKLLKKFISFFYLFMIICSFVFSFNPINLVNVVSASWWDSDYNNYRMITIAGDFIDENLVNFPVLVVLDNTTGDYWFNDDGSDIEFISLDNTTQFNHEIELFNNTGETFIWVNISDTMNTGTDYSFLVYYNDSVATGVNYNPLDVWDSDYQAVYHMNQTISDDIIIDSTSNYHNSTNTLGTPDYSQTGIVGDAIYYLGNTQESGEGHTVDALLSNPQAENGYTVEYWRYGHNISSTTEYTDVLIATDAYIQSYIKHDGSSHKTTHFTEDDGTSTDFLYGSETIVSAVWYYMVSSYDGTNKYVYTNASDRQTSVEASIIDYNGHDRIGCNNYATGRWGADADLDEIRVSKICRTWGWINTTFNNINQTIGFMNIGSEETYGGGWSNSNPINSNPSPSNGNNTVEIPPDNFSIYVSDADVGINQTLNVSFWTNESGSWLLAQTNASVVNGTYYLTNNSWVDTGNTYYWWSVNTSDGEGGWDNDTFYFKTFTDFNETIGIVDCLIEFDANTSSTSYKIFYGNHSNITISDNYTYIDPDDCNYTNRVSRKMIILGLVEDTTYYYHVYDYDNSEWYGDEQNFTTLPRFTNDTGLKDEFFDLYLINSYYNVSIVQLEGVKNDSYILDRSFGSGWRGLDWTNVINDSGTWRMWCVNRSDLDALEYFTSTNGISWTFVDDIDISGMPGGDTRFYACIIKENNDYFEIGKGAIGFANVANSSIPNGTFVVLPDGGHVVDTTLVNLPNECAPNCLFNDSLSVSNYFSTGQYYVESSNVRHIGRFIGFNFTDWLYFNDYVDLPATPDEGGVYSAQTYSFMVGLRNGVYYGMYCYYNGSGNNGTVEPYLVISRNGSVWSFIDGYNSTMIIPLGANGEWDDSMIYPARNGIITNNERDYVYYNAYDVYHGDSSGGPSRIGVISWREDGMTCIQPSSSDGWLLTDPISTYLVGNFTVNGNFSNDNKLNISVVNSSSGLPFTSFDFSDFDTITTNSTSIEPTWDGYNLSYIPSGFDYQLNFSFDGSDSQLFSYSVTYGEHDSVPYVNNCPTAVFNPANGSRAGVSISTNMNVSVSDLDGNNTYANWSCSDGSNGSWSNQPNGTQECDLSVLDYDTVYYFYINISDIYGCNVFYWVYFATESGSGANDSNHAYFIPDGTIQTQIDFQYPSDGLAHYLKVDDNNSGYPIGESDDSSTYVGLLDNPGETDIYSISNHTTESGNITNVKVVLRCYLQAGTGYTYCVIKHNGTIYYSPSFTLTPYLFADYYYNWTITPDTSESWSWSDIDNLGVGVKLSTWNHVQLLCSQVYLEVTYGPVYPPTNLTGVLYDDYLNITWDNGSNADSTLIRKATGDYPSDPTDGTLCQNSSLEYYNESYVSNTYYSFWSWNDTLSLYSEKIDFAYGGLLVNVFDEKTELNITGWNIFISNLNGSQVYSQTGCNNTLTIDVDDCPQGDVTILINATGYNNRVYSMNIYTGAWYSLDAYLPPTTPAGGGTSDCSQQVYIDSVIVSNPDVDAVINLTHVLDEMISVEIYNISLYGSYGGWLFVPSSKYSFNTTQVIINSSYLDINTSMARVNYYYQFCVGDVESALYYIRVVETVTTDYTSYDQAVENAFVEIKKYINISETYEVVSSLYTDANGYVNVYLIPNINYKVFINKTGFNDTISDYIPLPPNDYGQTVEKWFRITRTPIPFNPSIPYNFWDIISFNATMYSNGTILVCYLDELSNTSDATFYTYEVYNFTSTLKSYNFTSDDSYCFWVVDINDSRLHQIVIFLNQSNLGFDIVSINVLPVNLTTEFNTSNIESKIVNVFGNFSPGYVNFFLIYLPAIIIIVLSAPLNVGLGMIGSGLYLGGVSQFISVPTQVLILIPFIIALGILYILAKEGKIKL